jgi:hypothetical protein
MSGLLVQALKFVERRRIDRKQACIPCCIDRGLLPPTSCVITNYSVQGAQLCFERHETVASLPARFILRISRAGATGVTCEVRWRQLLTVGVEFARTKKDHTYTELDV